MSESETGDVPSRWSVRSWPPT